MRRPAFTLIELLVVILIIGIVIAIIVPALGNVRDVAKGTATKSLMNEVQNACTQFLQDENRLPGYFDARDMGHADNLNRGMSAMENVMLDLAGGIVPTGSAGPNVVTVGPRSNASTWISVDTDLIGVASSSNKAYFTPPKKNYIAQTNDGHQIGQAGHTAADGQPQLPDLVDAWRAPILFWAQDEATVTRIDAIDDIAAVDSSTGAVKSRFYWASNACFLGATALGDKGFNQTDTSAGKFSLLAPTVTDAVASLGAALGHPAYPNTLDNTLPTAVRGRFMLQSSGRDGFYFSSKDRGAKNFATTLMVFERNFEAADGSPYTENGKPVTKDILADFDDMIISGGN